MCSRNYIFILKSGQTQQKSKVTSKYRYFRKFFCFAHQIYMLFIIMDIRNNKKVLRMSKNDVNEINGLQRTELMVD